MTKLSKYIESHGKPFTQSFRNGQGRITVMYYDGYVTLRARVPGVRFRVEINIPRSVWLKLLTSAVRPTRLMEGPDFDADAAVRGYLAAEALFQGEKKESRRERDREAQAQAQKRRHQRAKVRARRSTS